jgi:hypothetical protein
MIDNSKPLVFAKEPEVIQLTFRNPNPKPLTEEEKKAKHEADQEKLRMDKEVYRARINLWAKRNL